MLYHAGVAWLLIISGVFGSSDVIRDIRVLKQDHVYYLDKISSNEELAGQDEQKQMDTHFNAMYFSPWTREKARYSKTEIEEELKIYRQNTGYGENLRRHSREWIDSLAENMDMDSFPNGGTRGISLTNADLRVFPTHRPHFNHCETGQCTYPFDNFQQSAVYVNTPRYIYPIGPGTGYGFLLRQGILMAGFLPRMWRKWMMILSNDGKKVDSLSRSRISFPFMMKMAIIYSMHRWGPFSRMTALMEKTRKSQLLYRMRTAGP
jgi:hypothetical protein